MLFITYNDSFSGIYRSQVIDVCRFFGDSLEEEIELVAFVSIRNYFKDRKEIRRTFAHSTVLPLFPGIKNWKRNQLLLNLLMVFRKRQGAITRGVFSTLLAQKCCKISSVIFDARGAYSAEWKEYMSGESSEIVREITELERKALFGADFRIAVSKQLVQYWKTEYGYNGKDYVIIPCTTDSDLDLLEDNKKRRSELGVKESEVLLVFSGSAAGWQSMERLYSILKGAFSINRSLKLLLLSRDNCDNDFFTLFPDRIIRTWVKPGAVPTYLNAADYGLLYRDDTVTNRVSSPVKFAEYLLAGLPVIISDNVGDYSKFVTEKNCGHLYSAIDWSVLKRTGAAERQRMKELAENYFRKKVYISEYRKIAEVEKAIAPKVSVRFFH